METPNVLHAARAGDEAAFRRLVEPCLPLAYRTALLIVLDRDLARDAVQEALLRTFRSLRSVRSEAEFPPWFRRVVVNEARRMAGRVRRQPVPVDSLPEMAAPPADSPEAQVLAQEDRQRLWHALATLDDLHRTVLVLRYYQELSEAELADALGIPPGTVKSRLHHARRLLQERMAGGPAAAQSLPSRWLSALQRRFS